MARDGEPTFLPLSSGRLRKGGAGCLGEEGRPFVKGDLPTENGGDAGRKEGREAGSAFGWGNSAAWASGCPTLRRVCITVFFSQTCGPLS